jgi:hypothetical protein
LWSLCLEKHPDAENHYDGIDSQHRYRKNPAQGEPNTNATRPRLPGNV